jgi:DNA modification methylase
VQRYSPKARCLDVSPQPFPEAHFATFPEELIKPCILARCPAGGVVLDPFMGAGTTALVAQNLNCKAVGVELNEGYIGIASRRLQQEVLAFA